jgi:hypothetical protein
MAESITLSGLRLSRTRLNAGRSEPVRFFDYGGAAAACFATTAVAAMASTDVVHWFVVPLAACGVVMGSDAIAWARGRLDTFDPKALIGLYGVYFFFLAPLLFIAIRAEMPYAISPPDWRSWIGAMGFVNLIGVLLYKGVQRWAQRGTIRLPTKWVAVPGRTGPVLLIGIFLSLASFVFVLTKLGGFSGMASAVTEESTSLHGIGIPRLLGYALPMLCFFVITIYARDRSWRRGGMTAALALLALLGILQLAVAGWSTARGESATAVVWILIGIHYLWRRLGRMTLLWLAIPAVLFLWTYTFYKSLGVKVFDYVRSGTSVSDLAYDSQRTFTGFLVGDMARCDIQAYILWMETDQPGAYDKWWGATYLTALAPTVPDWIWPGKPEHAGKLVAGTELQYGRGSYRPSERAFSSRAYGMAGEAMLNFGAWGVPVVFAMWGLFVGRFRRYLRSIPNGDLRLLAAPFGTYFLLNMLLWDSDNYVAHSVMRAAVPLVILFVAVGRSRRMAPIPTLAMEGPAPSDRIPSGWATGVVP